MGFAKGSQDWGGRRRLNPEGARRVSGDEVRAYAKAFHIEIKREGLGMWFYRQGDKWFTLGQTNYMAIENLKSKTDGRDNLLTKTKKRI